MNEIRQTLPFAEWMSKLRDGRAKAKIAVRIDRLIDDHFGDVAPVGEGVSELRIHTGPGYRVYFTKRGHKVILLLCGGDKKTQAKDIKEAKRLAALVED